MKLFNKLIFLLYISIILNCSSGGSSPTEIEANITSSPHYIEAYKSKTFNFVASAFAEDFSEITITFTLENLPMNGQVVIDGYQATYTPNAGYVGMDNFTVTASAGNSSISIPVSVDVFDNPYKNDELLIKNSLELGFYGDKKNELKITVEYNGIEREFIIIKPKLLSEFQKNGHPAVIYFHGNGGSASSIYINSPSFINNAKELNFYYIIPSGLQGVTGGGSDSEGSATGWNANFPGWNNEFNDVGFINALINHLHDEYSISHKNIYLIGFSSGAHFAYTLANRNILIDGFQVFGGWMNKYNDWEFNQSLKAQHYHGTKDHVDYYEQEQHFGGENSIKEIAIMKNCQSINEIELDDANANGLIDATLFDYKDCTDGSILQHFRLNDEVHVGSTSISRNDISSFDEFFKFFELGNPTY